MGFSEAVEAEGACAVCKRVAKGLAYLLTGLCWQFMEVRWAVVGAPLLWEASHTHPWSGLRLFCSDTSGFAFLTLVLTS